MLEPIQNHALRLCLGVFQTSPASRISVCVVQFMMLLIANFFLLKTVFKHAYHFELFRYWSYLLCCISGNVRSCQWSFVKTRDFDPGLICLLLHSMLFCPVNAVRVCSLWLCDGCSQLWRVLG